MSAIGTAAIAFACIFAGTFLGMFVRNKLPGHHLSGDTKDVVRLGTGLIATISGLVLGLLIGSANSSYETQDGLVRQLTANAVLLDATLGLYGPEAQSTRSGLRRALAILADRLWSKNDSVSGKGEVFEASTAGLALYDAILKLSPQNDAQRSLHARALDTVNDLAKTRLQLFTKSGGSIPMPFLVVLIAWLAIIFASFSLFADSNATSTAAQCIFALSASASIFLILELNQPFAGLLTIPDEPLRNALAPLVQ
jgi:hypothetical protein